MSYMTKAETEEAKAGIFAQLDEFEECVGISCWYNSTLTVLLIGTHRLLFSASASYVSDRRSITKQLGSISGLWRRPFL